MTHIEELHQGAARQSRKAANPWPVLDKIIEDHPGANREELLEMFREKVRDDDDLVDTMIDYWFSNRYRERIGDKMLSRNSTVDYLSSKALLQLPMPNGKRLQDSTKEECAKAGGWLTRVAAKVPPRKKVGEVLSEADLAKLWRGRK